ncbi:MAG: DUF2087 domain-containing protein, partial [Candidatus Riflebacteria bacterium]|nr:DUF2087 domain-containing protein [Candidatus Riflebacteria bacterium]
QSRCVEELADSLRLSSSTISFHLKKLETADFVRKEKQQYYTIFNVNREILKQTLAEILEFENPASEIQLEREEKARQQILKSFFRGKTLLRMPVQRKKQHIILQEVVKVFQFNIRYSEKEVNELLLQFNDDYCLLRRMLVDEGFMAREGGVYWRFMLEKPEEEQNFAVKSETKGKREKKMATRSELKRSYKESNIPAGIIQIKNLKNGKVFLKGTRNLNGALNSARFQLDFGSHPSSDLQKEWKEFGSDVFEFSVLDTINPADDGTKPSAEDITELEKQWFEKIQATEKYYKK